MSRSKLVNILTKIIVVDISFFPVDSFIALKTSTEGVLIDLAKEDLSGRLPPNFNLHSFKYFISGEFSGGL